MILKGGDTVIQNLGENFKNVSGAVDTLPGELIDELNIRLLGCGTYTTQVQSIPSFLLPTFLIVCYRGGTVELCHRGRTVRLSPGSFYIFMPYEVYGGVRVGGEPLRFSYLLFDILPYMERFRFGRTALSVPPDFFENETYRCMGRMLHALAQDPVCKPGRAAALRQYARFAAAQILYDGADTGGAAEVQPGRESRLIDHTFQYVAGHLGEPIVIGRVIRDVATSKTSLDRAFRKVLNLTPQQAIIRFKVERSMEMLLQNVPLKTIAHDLGYNSVYHFSNTFKLVTGMRPTEYRRNGSVWNRALSEKR